MATASGFVRELNSQCWELSQRSRKCKRVIIVHTTVVFYSALFSCCFLFCFFLFFSSLCSLLDPGMGSYCLTCKLIDIGFHPIHHFSLLTSKVSMVGSLNTYVDIIISVWLFRCWRCTHSWSCFLQYGDCENVSFWCSCVHCANICSIQEWMQSTRKESSSTLVKRRKMMPMETTDPPAILLLGILVWYSFPPWLSFSGFNLIFKGLEGFSAAGEAPVHMLYQVICVNLQFE